MTKFLLALGFIYGFMSLPTYAYLDPGATSILLQWIVGGIAALSTVGSLFFSRIKSFFLKLFKQRT